MMTLSEPVDCLILTHEIINDIDLAPVFLRFWGIGQAAVFDARVLVSDHLCEAVPGRMVGPVPEDGGFG